MLHLSGLLSIKFASDLVVRMLKESDLRAIEDQHPLSPEPTLDPAARFQCCGLFTGGISEPSSTREHALSRVSAVQEV